MIDNLLRRFTVRGRVFGGFLTLLLLLALLSPLALANHIFLSNRLEQVTNVEARADRLLLLASSRIASSRINLTRYIQNFTPSPYEARSDIEEAIRLLNEAESIATTPEDREAIANILAALVNYRSLIDDVEADSGQDERKVFLTYSLGNDISQRIEQIVEKSETRIAETNQAVLAEANTRLIVLSAGFAVMFVFTLFVSRAVSLSITRPVAQLLQGAEAFRAGYLETYIPVDGTDEMSRLAQAFNRMAAELSKLYRDLERRVLDRTRALTASVEVSRQLSTILDQSQLVATVVDQVRDAFDYYHVHIYLLDESGKNLVMAGGTGVPGQQMLASGHRIPMGTGLVGGAGETNTVVLAPDVSRRPDWLPNPLLPETKAEVAIPIAIGDTLLGVLDVQHNVRNGLDADDVDILQAIANQVAVALRNARLYEQTRRQAEREALINEISQKIQNATTIDGALQVAVRELGRAVGAKQTSVRLTAMLEPENGRG